MSLIIEKLKRNKITSELIHLAHYLKPYRNLQIAVTCLIFIITAFNLSYPQLQKFLIDDAIMKKDINKAILFITLLLIIFLMHKAIFFVYMYAINYTKGQFGFDLQNRLFERLINMNYLTLQKYESGNILTTIFSDVESVKSCLSELFVTLLTESILLFGIWAVMFTMHIKLTLVAILPIIFYTLISHSFSKNLRKRSKIVREEIESVTGNVQESFSGIQTIKSLNVGDYEIKNFSISAMKLFKSKFRLAMNSTLAGITISSCLSIGSFFLMGYAAFLVINDKITLGALFAFNSYFGMMQGPITSLINQNFQLQTSYISMSRIEDLLNSPQENNLYTQHLNKFCDSLKLTDVMLKLNSNSALKEINLEIKKGEKVAIMGSNGSGKSSFCKLLCGLFIDYSGTISIDGRDIKNLSPKNLRKIINYIPQDTFIFARTLKENLYIEFLKPSYPMNNLLNLLKRFNMDYDKPLLEKGTNISGGQKQILSLFRAYIKNSEIILFDEPTSSLDPEAKKLFFEFVDRYFNEKTLIFVNHDIEQLENFKRVIVFKNGEIVLDSFHPLENKSNIAHLCEV